MKIPNFSNLIQVGKSMIMANRPELLLGAAIAATVGSVVLAAQGGYKSGKQVTEADAVRAAQGDDALTKTEITVLTWANYVPAAGVALTAVASTCGLHWIHVKEKKALVATGLAAVEEATKSCKAYIQEIEDSVSENASKKTKDKIDNSIMERNADRHGDGVARVLGADGVLTEKYLVRDLRTGRDIWSSVQEITQALYEFNVMLGNEGEASVNKFYDEAGFATLSDGEDFGWNGGDYPVELVWSLTTRDDGRPVRAFGFRRSPEAGFGQSER